MANFSYTGDGIVLIDGQAKTYIFVSGFKKNSPHKLNFTTGDDNIEGHWEDSWQDKWQGPAESASAEFKNVSAVSGKWEKNWQSNWLPAYMDWLAPHPAGAPSHSTSQQNDINTGHGPERYLDHLPDATNYINGSNPPAVKSVLSANSK